MSEKIKPFCTSCHGDLDPSHVQQGGMHLECATKEVIVYTITQHETRYCVDFNDLVGALDELAFDNEVMTIRKRKMTNLEFENLPEFTGF